MRSPWGFRVDDSAICSLDNGAVTWTGFTGRRQPAGGGNYFPPNSLPRIDFCPLTLLTSAVCLPTILRRGWFHGSTLGLSRGPQRRRSAPVANLPGVWPAGGLQASPRRGR